MPGKGRPRFVTLASLLEARFPGLDVTAALRDRRVTVDGVVAQNSRAWVRRTAALRVRDAPMLRGTRKLAHALVEFDVGPLVGHVALDLGAAAGGFTQALLDAGARRVYAVDAGVGQLRGWLRSDPRVVNLERTNLASLDARVVPDVVDVVAVDLSYLSLAAALPQLERVRVRPGGHLVALVKPTFELGRRALAASDLELDEAVRRATAAASSTGWSVVGSTRSPWRGARGAVEAFVHGVRTTAVDP